MDIYNARVLENMPVDTNVTFVSAKDLDTGINGFITYVISPSAKVPFMVFPDGTIKTADILQNSLEINMTYLLLILLNLVEFNPLL